MKIAIVDDDQSVRKALARVLTADEIETSIFSSGAEFLASLAEQIPDCLMLDLQMPGMNGFEVQQALKDAGLATPVIAITGNDDSHIRKQTLDAGALACLIKPEDMGVLLDTIHRLVAGNDGAAAA